MPNKPNTEELFDMDLARRLYSFRYEFVHKQQKAAAKLLKVSAPYLSAAENGKRPVSYEIVDTLANDFDMNRDWFSTGHGNRRVTGREKSTAASSLQAVQANVMNIMKNIKILEKNLSQAYNLIDRLSKQNEALQKRVEELEKKI